MSENNTNEKIEDYLAGELSDQELEQFEKKLKSDQKLAIETQLRRDVELAINDEDATNFQQLIQQQGEEYLGKPQENSGKLRQLKPTKKWWAIAASIVVLIATAVFFWQESNTYTKSGDELYAQFFTTYSLNSAVRGNDNLLSDSLIEQGIQQYQAGDFIEAIRVFQQQREISPANMFIAFALAQAYLNTDPPQLIEAETQLQRIISDQRNVYLPSAQWYLALIQLKRQETELAKELLQEVVGAGGQLKQQAEELLKELE